jgi:hypothetical protein
MTPETGDASSGHFRPHPVNQRSRHGIAIGDRLAVLAHALDLAADRVGSQAVRFIEGSHHR